MRVFDKIIGAVILLGSISLIGWMVYKAVTIEPNILDNEKWCIKKGGKYFTGGFGTPNCIFPPN